MSDSLAIVSEFCRLCPNVTGDGWRVEIDGHSVIHIYPPSDAVRNQFLKLPGFASEIGQAVQTLELPMALIRSEADPQGYCHQVDPGAARAVATGFSRR